MSCHHTLHVNFSEPGAFSSGPLNNFGCEAIYAVACLDP